MRRAEHGLSLLTYDRWGIIASKESIWKQEEGGERGGEGVVVVVVVGFCQRARVAFESGCATLCTGDVRHKQRLARLKRAAGAPKCTTFKTSAAA